MKKENDQSRKIFSLQPYHPCLMSKPKHGRAWLVLEWETNLQKRLLRDKQLGDRGECHQSSNGVTCARPLKNNQGQEDWRNGSYTCVYLALKPFQIQTHIFRQGLLLRDKMTIFTGSKHVLWYLKMVVLTFLNNEFYWTYIMTVYCCQGNSTKLKKNTVRVKE
jgi:hypothetical protein